MTGPSKATAYAQHEYRSPDDATEILLVRHGASQAFVPGEDFPMLGDQGDPPLSPEGRVQAEKVCARLAWEPIEKVYVTKLQRTIETAAPLLEELGLEAEVSPHLHEIHFGDWEGGLARQKLTELTDPAAIEARRTGTWDSVPGAERWEDFTARVTLGLNEIAAANPGGNVAAFAHGVVIGAATRTLIDAPRRLGTVENCSITHLIKTGDVWMIRSFNDTAHLMSLFTRRLGSGS